MMNLVSRCRMLCPLWLVSLIIFLSLLVCFRIQTSKLKFLLLLVMRTHSRELVQEGGAFPSSDGGHIHRLCLESQVMHRSHFRSSSSYDLTCSEARHSALHCPVKRPLFPCIFVQSDMIPFDTP